MNEKIVLTAQGYDRVDGRNAYQSTVKKLTLGAPVNEENKKMQIAAQLWKENKDGELAISMELPIHQIFDLMIFLSRTLLYFKEAYRFPLLYNPDNPTVERIGVQGGVLPVEICVDNPNINEDIQTFSQSLSDLGELTGERLRTLTHIIEELELY
ncbi:DUF6530 family protein [Claveliimonas bilis]|uniref:Uncharacterized protein n=1 Tax=Claveliimonas bilis TaxID=3028070 RepID=A0ABM8I6L4_9FIRM|nr:DUF6530 family protein [Claveliimonas bilis]BDZ76207.1 hypothetical protein Lac1_03900 [Claveliimonas bilis]